MQVLLYCIVTLLQITGCPGSMLHDSIPVRAVGSEVRPLCRASSQQSYQPDPELSQGELMASWYTETTLS
jgi:hypothetical protein